MLGFVEFLGQFAEHLLHERQYAVAMRGRDTDRLAHAELVELSGVLGGQPLALVHREINRALASAQTLHDSFIVRRQTRAGVSDENHHIGFGNGGLGLIGHFAHDAFGLDGLKAARIHHDVGTGAHATLTVLTISGQAREISHDRVAAAGQTVKERRLADIRTPDESDNRKHRNRFLELLGNGNVGNLTFIGLENGAIAQRDRGHSHGAVHRRAADELARLGIQEVHHAVIVADGNYFVQNGNSRGRAPQKGGILPDKFAVA